MQQHQMLQRQQQARNQMMAQQAYNANMAQGGGGMPMGMAQLTQQQIHQLRQSGRMPVRLSPLYFALLR
jgi:hypothetical protein